ncbi:MAG: translation elongation factor 4 [Patescibacteria group bacterium]
MLKALIFDSFFDKHRGVIAFVRLFQGTIRAGDTIHFLATNSKASVNEVGVFKPDMCPIDSLSSGEVGYIVTGLKELDLVKVGDTVSSTNVSSNALSGYKEVEPKVYSSIFPIDADDYPKLRDAIAKLKLNDASLSFETENIPALGFGFRCGFLGLLHMDIVQERLHREFNLDLILTTPSVQYEVATTNNETLIIHTPSELPDPSQIVSIKEPKIRMELITPEAYIGKIIELVTSRRGNYSTMSTLSIGQIQITCNMPLAEMIVDFYDDLKSATKGYATMSYEITGFEQEDLVKVDILVHGKVVDPLSFMTHRSNSETKGRHVCEKLKEQIPRQQFEIPIQAAIGARVIARETVKAFRKDVTAKLYGGDITRRMKLLDKQKEGKKRMKMVGNVEIPQSAFLNILKK